LGTLWIVFTVIVAMFFIEAGVFGYFLKPTSLPERLLFVAGGLFLLSSTMVTDIIGLALVAVGVLSHKFMPAVPFFGNRPEELPRVDLEDIDWGDGKSIADMNVS